MTSNFKVVLAMCANSLCNEERWEKMLVKLWVKNNIFNIQSVREDQCIKTFLMFSATFFNISPFFDKF